MKQVNGATPEDIAAIKHKIVCAHEIGETLTLAAEVITKLLEMREFYDFLEKHEDDMNVVCRDQMAEASTMFSLLENFCDVADAFED